MNETILLVDDDPNVLNGYRRTLRKKFKLKTALGSIQGLKTFIDEGPFAVIISDMKMPDMDGIEFLQKVKDHDPETVRIMLSGFAEFDSVLKAINQGHIFRFITKPCSPDDMASAIQAGIEQYRLIRSKKDLLENTLKSSVKVLTDILGMTNPAAFSRASRIRHYVVQLAELLNFKESWILEISAMLSQIGFVALPTELLEKIYRMEDLTEEENMMYREYPQIGANLIQGIPRLDIVSGIILKQLWDFETHQKNPSQSYEEKLITLGAQILKAVMSFDEQISRGLAPETVIALMKRKSSVFNPKIVDILKKIKTVFDFSVTKKVNVEEMTTEMITVEEIRSKDGLLLVPKYHELSSMNIERLKRRKYESGVKEPISVAVMNF